MLLYELLDTSEKYVTRGASFQSLRKNYGEADHTLSAC